ADLVTGVQTCALPIYEDAHFFFFAFLAFFAFGAFFLAFGLGFAVFAFTAATTFFPASPMLSAEMIGSPESLRIFLPRSSLVPFKIGRASCRGRLLISV